MIAAPAGLTAMFRAAESEAYPRMLPIVAFSDHRSAVYVLNEDGALENLEDAKQRLDEPFAGIHDVLFNDREVYA